MLIDGVVAGIWERRKRGRRIELQAEPFRRLTAPQRRGLEAEAARVGEFLGSEVQLSVSALASE
jgi:hypothetical protein